MVRRTVRLAANRHAPRRRCAATTAPPPVGRCFGPGGPILVLLTLRAPRRHLTWIDRGWGSNREGRRGRSKPDHHSQHFPRRVNHRRCPTGVGAMAFRTKTGDDQLGGARLARVATSRRVRATVGAPTAEQFAKDQRRRRRRCSCKRQSPRAYGCGAMKEIRRRPTLPGGIPPSTIGADRLNFRVRNGNGCDSVAKATENFRPGPQEGTQYVEG